MLSCVALSAALCACEERNIATTSYLEIALDSHGELPDWEGSCAGARTSGSSLSIDRAISDVHYRANSAGRTTLKCSSGTLVVDVRDVQRLEIEGPDEVGEEWYPVHAYGDGVELNLGEEPGLDFQLMGPLERVNTCGDMVGALCGDNPLIAVRATAPGEGVIMATRGSAVTARRFRTFVRPH